MLDVELLTHLLLDVLEVDMQALGFLFDQLGEMAELVTDLVDKQPGCVREYAIVKDCLAAPLQLLLIIDLHDLVFRHH